MNFNMNIPGLKDVVIGKIEEVGERTALHISLPIKPHKCPNCGEMTTKVHDYRMQKIKHLKWFERLTVLFYKRRRYACACGKRFAEKSPFVDKYQRYIKERNQVVRIRSVKAKTFKEAGEVLGKSSSTVIRRFKEVAKNHIASGVRLPKIIAIDEYKGDTDAGTYQLIIADRFHYCRYIYWAIDEVRRKVQKEWHAYDRKKCKRMRHVLYKRSEKLTEKNRWYLDRYLGMSEELKKAYELKEAYCEWFDWAKTTEDVAEVKRRLEAFYRKVEEATIPAFLKAIRTFKNWQVEILNSFSFKYSNGFLEGINNKTKVMKRNAYGFRRFDHFKAKILLNIKYKKTSILSTILAKDMHVSATHIEKICTR